MRYYKDYGDGSKRVEMTHLQAREYLSEHGGYDFDSTYEMLEHVGEIRCQYAWVVVEGE